MPCLLAAESYAILSESVGKRRSGKRRDVLFKRQSLLSGLPAAPVRKQTFCMLLSEIRSCIDGSSGIRRSAGTEHERVY